MEIKDLTTVLSLLVSLGALALSFTVFSTSAKNRQRDKMFEASKLRLELLKTYGQINAVGNAHVGASRMTLHIGQKLAADSPAALNDPLLRLLQSSLTDTIESIQIGLDEASKASASVTAVWKAYDPQSVDEVLDRLTSVVGGAYGLEALVRCDIWQLRIEAYNARLRELLVEGLVSAPVSPATSLVAETNPLAPADFAP